MRIQTICIFAFSTVFAWCTNATAQEGITQFPWRNGQGNSEVSEPVRTTEGYRVAALPQQLTTRPRMKLPKAPVMSRNRFLVGFRQEKAQGLADAQSSVSDVIAGEIKPPPTPQAAASALDIPEVPNVTADIQPAPEDPYVPVYEPSLAIPENEPETVTNYCDRDCRRDWCNLGCEKKLFGSHCSGFNVGGWLSLGYHNRNNILVNNRKAEANLHQAWLYFDQPLNQRGFGYHVDVLYGIDGQDLQAFGNEPTGNPTGWDNSWDFGSYGWAIPQAYVNFNYSDWDIQAGKFFSPFGYEVIGATGNFFYSHSYTMYNTEPFTMTGVLGEREIRDNLSVVAGVTLGWDTAFESNSGGLNLITGTRYQPNDYVDLALTTSLGDTGARGSGTMTSGVAQLQLLDDLRYVFQADILNLGTNQEFGVVQYLFRDVSPCVGLGARLEWWKSDQFFTDTKSTWDFTVGANIRPHANIVFRPELRFDWGAAAISPGQPIIGIDAVMTF